MLGIVGTKVRTKLDRDVLDEEFRIDPQADLYREVKGTLKCSRPGASRGFTGVGRRVDNVSSSRDDSVLIACLCRSTSLVRDVRVITC